MLKFWKKKPVEDVPAAPAPAGEQQLIEEAAAETRAGPMGASAPIEPRLAESTPAAPVRRSWRERLSGSGLAKGLGSLFSRNPVLDDALLDELETVLITADVGVSASAEIVDDLRENCEGAEAVGMTAVRHREPAETIERLAELTGVELSAGGNEDDAG